MSDSTMNQPLYRDLIIVNELGLHARSAAKLAQLARKARGGVWLENERERVDAKQVIDILLLAAVKDDQVRITIDDRRDSEILDRIALLVEDGFGE
jgi:phosphocarrier protein HPr